MAKIALIASSGGHLYELYSLKNFWSEKEFFWVSFLSQDAKYMLKDFNVYWAYYPTNRNIKNLGKNFFLAFKIIKKERPHAIISTGAGVAVPFIIAGKLFRIKTLYVESITRKNSLSLTAKLIYFFVDKMFVQWPELSSRYKKTEFFGRIL